MPGHLDPGVERAPTAVASQESGTWKTRWGLAVEDRDNPVGQ
jgi:hypothetical protein